jgi:ABC-2 type transport system ATP-binding protein
MNEKAIVISNLTKKYGNKIAVDNLSLEVNKGELISLLGVNGAGKTTTIKMLTALTKADAGKAEIYGLDVEKESDKIKPIVGISTQDTAVAENLTVRENLKFMSDIFYENSMDADEAIEKFGLEEYRNTKAKQLSGGWKRKLSIAMAIVGKPKVLFLDEPTLGLDVIARRELWREIEKLKKETTIVLTTHYMEEAQALSDKIAVMIKGKLSAFGTLEDLEKMTGKKGLEEAFISIVEGI